MVPFRRPGLVLPLAGVALSLGAQEAYSIPDSEEEALKALVALFNTPVESASKRSQKSLESPQAIEVLSGDQIRASGVFRLHDLLKLMTNVQVWEVDYQSTWVGMRGVSPNGAPHNVQVLLDGVPLYNAEVFSVDVDDLPIPIDAIDRVEVVRGPSSSLYGANAQVGVISILTKRAKDGSTGSLRASAAEGGTFHNQGFYGFGSSGFHFTTGFGGYSVRDSDHTLRAIAGTRTVEHQDQGHGSQVFLRPEATFAGGKFWAMYAKGSKLYAPQTAESLTGVLLYQFSHLSGSAEVAQVGWSQTWSPALRSEVKLNRDHSTIGFGPISVIPGSPTSAFVVPFLLSLDPGLGADYDLADFKNEQLAIQINWDPSDKLHFVFGGDSSRLRGGKAPIIGLKAEQTEHATGGFLSMDWELGAATLSLGARAENESLGGSRISPRIAGVYSLGGTRCFGPGISPPRAVPK